MLEYPSSPLVQSMKSWARHSKFPYLQEPRLVPQSRSQYSTERRETALPFSGWLGSKYSTLFLCVICILTSHALRQTQGKQFSYLFSQCQPIYARALAPLQGEIYFRFDSVLRIHTTRRYTFVKNRASFVKYKPPSDPPQTYTASVASVLPVLLSAIRVSPPSEGSPHDGRVIGKDVVSYVYEQV
jgi:hypothetical protein